jgi:hypothetical protein
VEPRDPCLEVDLKELQELRKLLMIAVENARETVERVRASKEG